jgi:probable FeS assembly SUF system protein SufT
VIAAGDWVALSRACFVFTIPYGEAAVLDEGDEVQIVQTLGGSVTVRTATGRLLRVGEADVDALGQEPVAAPAPPAPAGVFAMDRVVEALQRVFDPEIPVSIVELGLVYRCEEEVDPDGRRRIVIDLSMTAPGCGMGDVLRGDAERAVRAVPGVDDVRATLVWDPPWTLDRMSEAARLELGLL